MFFVRFYSLLFFAACVLTNASCNLPRSSDNQSDPSRQPAANQPAPNSNGSPKAIDISYDFASLDSLLERIGRKHGGCALVLVKDEKIIYRKAFGRYGPDKVVPIASASKWLSGAVIMTLVDEGRLSLDDKVSKYIPEFSGDKSDITIRHLFAHTSGLPPEARCRNDKRTTLEQCAREISQIRLTAAPGEQFYYGGVSMHVGGRIAEIVTGKSWNELFVERIAAPLDMSQTDFLAYGPTRNPRAAGDARSSADDYARFLQMIVQSGMFRGKRILSAASVIEMHKDQTKSARISYTIYEKHKAIDPNLLLARYGVGVWREKVDATSQGLREASSQGALGFSPWIDVERKLAGVLSVKSSFSRVLPDYFILKDEIRRIVPKDASPMLLH